jgi:hypothetical protein
MHHLSLLFCRPSTPIHPLQHPILSIPLTRCSARSQDVIPKYFMQSGLVSWAIRDHESMKTKPRQPSRNAFSARPSIIICLRTVHITCSILGFKCFSSEETSSLGCAASNNQEPLLWSWPADRDHGENAYGSAQCLKTPNSKCTRLCLVRSSCFSEHIVFRLQLSRRLKRERQESRIPRS